MPTSTSSEPTHHATDPAATPGPSSAGASKPTTPRARHHSTRRTTPAQRAPPTPPAAGPSSVGTPNGAGSTALPHARRPGLRGPLDRQGVRPDALPLGLVARDLVLALLRERDVVPAVQQPLAHVGVD